MKRRESHGGSSRMNANSIDLTCSIERASEKIRREIPVVMLIRSCDFIKTAGVNFAVHGAARRPSPSHPSDFAEGRRNGVRLPLSHRGRTVIDLCSASASRLRGTYSKQILQIPVVCIMQTYENTQVTYSLIQNQRVVLVEPQNFEARTHVFEVMY